MEIETLLQDEIRNEFEELKKMELGTEKYKVTVDGLTKLVDKAIEMEKIEIEHEEKAIIFETDNKLKMSQIKEDRKNQLFSNGIAIFSVAAPIALTVWGTLKSLKFEETGTVTTIIGRGFINKLLPKK